MNVQINSTYTALLFLVGVLHVLGNRTDLSAECFDCCTSVNCSSNVTSDQQLNESSSATPLFWCPDGYKRFRKNNRTTQACRPRSCYGLKNNDTKSCKKFSDTFTNCPKQYLNEDQYKIDDKGDLLNSYRNLSARWGDYFIEFTRAIICDSAGNGTLETPINAAKLPNWCMPIVVPIGSNVENMDLNLSIDKNGVAHVCPEISSEITDNCQNNLAIIENFAVLPNWDIRQDTFVDSHIFHRGEYILAEDRSFSIICTVPDEPVPQLVKQLNGCASLFSVLCLLLTILAHLFYERLSHHARSLLCLAFSYLVMYTALTVRYFSDNFESEVANMTLFAFQYISALSAFFWLSILGFDLWKAFDNLRGPCTSRTSTRQKRIFYAKCVYAWGIPIVLYIVVIALTYSPNVQNNLGLGLDLHTTSWFHDYKTALIILYTPIIIALLENIVFFILTIVNLRKASSGTKLVNSRVNKKLFRVYVKLFLVMGLCWLAEIIAGLAKYNTNSKVWYATDMINCLQGVFLFVIYVCKKSTMRIIKSKLGCSNSNQTKQSSFPVSTQESVNKEPTIKLETFKSLETLHPIEINN